ncbi:unnamed protein product [Anisakis simplex]|uniref:Zinc_ribbon_16 domain-containing protein n=1 Tax=Anisakis simplex TaxID=6269 RepID=A0A0M3JTC7_ANISI|nr:unnamed protein product [Anisakis simplex]
MQCDVRWLKDYPNRFIYLTPDCFNLCQVDDDFKTKVLADFPVCVNQRMEQDRLRCFSLSPVSDGLLALGYAYGRVLVTEVAIDPDISARAADFTVCVFDVKRPTLNMFHLNSPERVKSTTWFADDPSLIGIGGRRTLKLYDIREGTRPLFNTSIASQIRAIKSDNIRHQRFACLFDDYVNVYDRRNLSSVLYKITLSKFPKGDTTEAKLCWNPHHPFSLTVLDRGSRTITELLVSSCEVDSDSQAHQPSDCDSGEIRRLRGSMAKFELNDETAYELPLSDHDDVLEIDDALSVKDEEQSIAKHPYFEVKHNCNRVPSIYGFDWHRTIRNRLLLGGMNTRSGTYAVAVVQVNNFVTCDMSPEAQIVRSNEMNFYVHELSSVPCNGNKEPDLSTIMRLRAVRNYGTPGTTALDAYIRSCKDIIESCPYANADLKWVWKWLWQMIYITDWRPEVYGTWFPGVLQVMEHSLAGPKKGGSTTERIIVTDPLLGRIRVYKGKERDRVLRLCGWPPFDDIARLDVFIDENALERPTQSRAVAAAVFTGHTGRMKKILSEMVGAAKLSNEKSRDEIEKFYEAVIHYKGVSEQWKPISEKLKKVVKDPYFTMILAFLNGRCENYTEQHQILRLERVPLEDRIAFAAIHFNDQWFMNSIKKLFYDTTLRKRLPGLFIAGLSQDSETHRLLNEYVDDTGDVQTATLLLITGHCFAPFVQRAVSVPLDESQQATHEDSEIFSASEDVDSDEFMNRRKYVMQSYCYVQDYLEMLNRWALWTQRARLDCLLQWRKIYEYIGGGNSGCYVNSTAMMATGAATSSAATTSHSIQNSAMVGGADSELHEAPEVNGWPSMEASELEIAIGKTNQDRAEAEVCCQFCAYPVTLEKPELAIPISSTLSVPSNRVTSSTSCSLPTTKSSKSVNTAVLLSARDVACQQCYKPLPKCVLCRRHMGTLTPSECPALGSLSSWFTWCQQCRHGGHMAHLWHWFAKHDECAASGCLCKCKLADLNMFNCKSAYNSNAVVVSCTCSDGI